MQTCTALTFLSFTVQASCHHRLTRFYPDSEIYFMRPPMRPAELSADPLHGDTQGAAFSALVNHYEHASAWHMRALFVDDSSRFDKMSVNAAGLFLDYSKNRMSLETRTLLCALAKERGVEQKRDQMFAGEKINVTEDRAVLHTALRAPGNTGLVIEGQDVDAEVREVLEQMQGFVDKVRNGTWLGSSGKALTSIVNIGIGGSYLGPKMACQALRASSHAKLDFHFVSNVDANELGALLPELDPETTLFIVASKTFSTTETMMNARAARKWMMEHCGNDSPSRHFIAVSTNVDAVKEFGIDPANMFRFWDWVGGRYSVWSSVGISVAMAIGMEGFKEFLAGGHAMDQHFVTASLEENMPVILGMIGVWYRNFFDASTVTIAPYWQDLQHLPGYLQQLDMESNGKHIRLDGNPVDLRTGPVIWGDVGTNGQHAFFQLLHQGSDMVPVDFITVLAPPATLPDHHTTLLANCFAQSAALMLGKNKEEARTELRQTDMDDAAIERLLPHKTFVGNRPSNTILLQAMTPHSLGALIALYEHKVFVQGVIWGINSFDQWGVELGKALAKGVQSALTKTSGSDDDSTHDSSTQGLVEMARKASGTSRGH